MKRLILLIVTLAAAATRLFAAHLCPSTGRVVDEQGKAVEYATVVLLKGTEQVAGMATDAEGRFALKAPFLISSLPLKQLLTFTIISSLS